MSELRWKIPRFTNSLARSSAYSAMRCVVPRTTERMTARAKQVPERSLPRVRLSQIVREAMMPVLSRPWWRRVPYVDRLTLVCQWAQWEGLGVSDAQVKAHVRRLFTRPPSRRRRWHCLDCGIDTIEIGEYPYS